ncbi:MAG: hypothetical protein ACOH5I_06285 [Oligoflexus sp.]
MNAIYLCCISEPWIEVANQLMSRYQIKPRYFVHWSKESSNFTSNKFPNCFFQSVEDAWKGVGFPTDFGKIFLDEELIQRIAWYELIAIKMMDRLDPTGNNFPFNNRQYFFHDLICHWLAVVKKFEIKLVISPSIPHRVFDYALYVVCKLLNLEFISFEMTPFENTSILIDNLDALPVYSQASSSYKRTLSNSILKRINQVKSDYSLAKPFYMIEQDKKSRIGFQTFTKLLSVSTKLPKLILSSPNTYWVQKSKMPQDTQFGWIEYYFLKIRCWFRVHKFRMMYKELVSTQIDQPFVLVALHYQPEATSSPTGGSYVDQILILQVLHETLPQNVKIVIKEHQSQFYSHLESAQGRNLYFYKRIRQVSDRVIFAPVEYDPFKLVDEAIATITISGTIGWESAIRGTPAIIFGRAWYEGMPRVIKVKTKGDLRKALVQVQKLKNIDLDDEILNFHKFIENLSIKAIHYKSYALRGGMTISESVKNICEKIFYHLGEKGYFAHDR